MINDHIDRGYCPVAQRADFELSKNGCGDWRLRVISIKGLRWAQAYSSNLVENERSLTLAEANSFLKIARQSGLKTEYVGPIGRSLL